MLLRQHPDRPWSPPAPDRGAPTLGSLLAAVAPSTARIALIFGLTTTLLSTSTIDAQMFRRGDVTDDAVVSLFDVCAINQFLFVGTPLPCPDAADVDDDGIVQLADALMLINYLCVPLSPPPFSPGPIICGLDPTPDALPLCNYATCNLPVPPPNSRFIRGDCDLSLAVGLGDAITMLNILFGAALMPCGNACDTNGDGAVNIADPLHVLSFLFFAGSPPPPAPFPTCGCDPTSCPITLDCATSTCP